MILFALVAIAVANAVSLGKQIDTEELNAEAEE